LSGGRETVYKQEGEEQVAHDKFLVT
jgi:hypothetical protein